MPPKAAKVTSHKCSQCDKAFPTKRELILHQYIHQEKPNTTCAACNRTFPNELSYRRHMRMHSSKQKRSKICQICSEGFENAHELDKHHRQKHLEDKRFRCQICGVEFSWQENLRKHMRMHKPDGHVCQTCHRSFDDMTSLRLHVKLTHEKKPNADKPYVCTLCQKSFKYDFSYEAHLNAHQVPSSTDAKTSASATLTVSSTVSSLPPCPVVSTPASVSTSVPVSVPVSVAGHLKPAVQVLKPDKQGIINIKPVDPKSNKTQEIIVEIVNMQPGQKLLVEKNTTVNIPSVSKDDVKPIVVQPMQPVQAGKQDTSSETIETDSDSSSDDETDSSDSESSDSDKDDNESDDDDEDEDDDDKDQGESELNIVEEPNNAEKDDKKSEESAEDKDSQAPPQLSLARPMVRRGAGTRAQKKVRKKRQIRPLMYDFVMTEEKPFICEICSQSFRWEISLNIHRATHDKKEEEKEKKKRRSSLPKKQLPVQLATNVVKIIRPAVLIKPPEQPPPQAPPPPLPLPPPEEINLVIGPSIDPIVQPPQIPMVTTASVPVSMAPPAPLLDTSTVSTVDMEECLKMLMGNQGPPIIPHTTQLAQVENKEPDNQAPLQQAPREPAPQENTAEKHTQTSELEDLSGEQDDEEEVELRTPRKVGSKTYKRGRKRRASGKMSRIVQPNASDEEDFHQVLSSPELSPGSNKARSPRSPRTPVTVRTSAGHGEENNLKMRLKKGEGQGYMLVTMATDANSNIGSKASKKRENPTPAKKTRKSRK